MDVIVEPPGRLLHLLGIVPGSVSNRLEHGLGLQCQGQHTKMTVGHGLGLTGGVADRKTYARA